MENFELWRAILIIFVMVGIVAWGTIGGIPLRKLEKQNNRWLKTQHEFHCKQAMNWINQWEEIFKSGKIWY